ncbi:hypothetical protein JW949_04435 [Candidatus Woesearchaeota archaeon]|jgi:hypothetical protein|nr:hypothetical protein [Candidatus Woesearchaeota archaeon]
MAKKKKKTSKTKGKKKTKATKKSSILNKEISPEKYFILNSGKAIATVRELVEELQIMNDELFRHHVNDERNDFANWIQDVFEDKKLAKKLREIKDREKTRTAIYKHIAELFY